MGRNASRAARGTLALLLCVAAGCSHGGDSAPARGAGEGAAGPVGRIVVFHAATLARPFGELEALFEERHPGADVVLESSNSREAIRKATDLGRPADIVASADAGLLKALMLPQHARWAASFAHDRVVIAYSQQSRYRSEINADNWFQILLRPDVRFACADPDLAPAGSATRLAWALADLHYGPLPDGRRISEALLARLSPDDIRPECQELVPLLETMSHDYIFEYRSVALQHHLQFLKLPDEVDLGNADMGALYARAQVTMKGEAPGTTYVRTGAPILYALTIPLDAPNPRGAEAFVSLLLGPEGQRIIEKCFLEPVSPAPCAGLDEAPEGLRPLLREEAP